MNRDKHGNKRTLEHRPVIIPSDWFQLSFHSLGVGEITSGDTSVFLSKYSNYIYLPNLHK